MGLLLRFPRFTAWLITITLIGGMTASAVLGLHSLAPSASVQLDHTHGYIVATRGDNEFALSEPGRRGVEWFRIAPGGHVSMAHLLRHLREHAATDVTYQTAGQGMPLVWTAD